MSARAETSRSGWFELVLLSAAQLMLVLDVTVVNIALPDLVRDLNATPEWSGFVVVAYGVFFGGLLLVGGRLADRFGPRRVLLTGLLLFSTASLIAGLSVSLPMLLSARVAQGVGAALLSPSALASITLRFDGATRTRALAIWSAIGGIGSALGVIVGGLLTAGPGWRWIFFINLPIGVVVLVLLPWVPAPTLCSHPTKELLASILPLLHRPTVKGALVAMLIATGLLVGSFFLASFALQRGLGWTSLQTGVAFLPMALGTLIGAHTGGHAVGHVGSRLLAVAGFAIAALGAGLASFGGQPILLIAGLAIASAGIGAIFVSAGITGLSNVEQANAGTVSALLNTAHEVGGAVAVSVLSVFAGGGVGGGFMGLAATSLVAAVAMIALVPSVKPASDATSFMH